MSADEFKGEPKMITSRASSAFTDTHAGRSDEVHMLPRLSLVSRDARTDGPARACIHLTPRQLEVLALLCQGLPNKLICRHLDISAGTVKAHISSILRELGVTSRLQAVVEARRRGLVQETKAAADGADSEVGTAGARHVAGRAFSAHVANNPLTGDESSN